MGKGKGQKKKAKPAVLVDQPVLRGSQDGDLLLSSQAMDGHNVEGWTQSQIKAYNELLLEREKLEKQRKELEQRSAVSQAGRALLNQNVFDIDSAFKQQTNGNYRFTSREKCCVEIGSDAACHHEICSRSKSEGLTPAEMDAVKYYHMRIVSEKSQRIRLALCKQRDLELSKLKKDEEQIKEKGTRKARLNDMVATSGSFESTSLSKATKETQRLVTSILDQLESLRTELQNGQISSTEMQKQLDIIDAEMHAAHLKTSKFKKASVGKAGLGVEQSSGSSPSLSSDASTQGKAESYNKAFHIMENFLSASKPGDFQLAVAELKEVLRLSGPMGDDLQNSFDALEGIFDSPDRLSFAGPDGKQECTSIIDLMEKMKETLKRTGKLPDGANSDLTRVFQDCISLETKGKRQLKDEYTNRDLSKTRSDLAEALLQVRASIVSKSPIPPLTEKSLDDEIDAILEQHDVLELIAKAKDGIGIAALEGYITSMVMVSAKRDPTRYIESIRRLALVYDTIKGQEHYTIIEEAFPRVESKMGSFVAKLANKQKILEQPPSTAPPPSPPASVHSDTTDLLDEYPANTAEIVSNAIKKMAEHDCGSEAHLPLRSLIAKHASSGLWPIWLLFTEETKFSEEHALQEKAQRFEHEIDNIMADQSGGLKNAVLYLYGAGACPGMCAAIISEILASMSEMGPATIQQYLSELAGCIGDLPSVVGQRWRSTFGHLALAMIQLYVAVNANVAIRFHDVQATDFALSTVAMVTTYVCLMSSAQRASENLKLICVFLNVCMSPDGVEPVREIIEVAKHYEAFCLDELYRCLTPEPCSQHFNPKSVSEALPTEQILAHRGPSGAPSSGQSSTTKSTAHDGVDTRHARSRFSELIEDGQVDTPQQAHLPASQPAQSKKKNLAPLLESDSPETVEKLSQMAKQNAMSGQFPNPVAAFSKAMETIFKDYQPSPALRDAMIRARAEIGNLMKQPRVHFAWSTRRLKFLLSLGGSITVPNCQALHDLALRDFSMFEEYAALLASGMANVANTVNQIKALCDETYDLLGESKLRSDSSCIQEFSKIALRDWAKRESGDNTRNMQQQAQSNHSDIMSRLQQFCTDLQDLESTRDKIESLTTQPNARKRQVKVFDDLVGELNQTRGVIMDVASIIAKNRNSSELEGFISRNSGRDNKHEVQPKAGRKRATK